MELFIVQQYDVFIKCLLQKMACRDRANNPILLAHYHVLIVFCLGFQHLSFSYFQPSNDFVDILFVLFS